MLGTEQWNTKVLLGIFGWAGLALASAAQVEWSLDTNRIQWGEPMELTASWLLSLEDWSAGEADSASWPAWTDTTNGGFEVLASLPFDTLKAPQGSSGDILLKKTWRLTSWDSGFVVLPPTQFGPHRTPPLLVQVLTPDLGADAQPRPAADIVKVRWTLWERLQRHGHWALYFLLLAAVVVAAIWLAKRLKNKPHDSRTEQQKVHVELPHVVALRELERLLAEEGWTRGHAKETQARASLVLRHYLEGAFDLPAAERTTGEIESLLPMSSVPREWHVRLTQGLHQADAVKFAKGNLPDVAHRAALEVYIQFVRETQPDTHEEG
jgi:hypothetical protein